ncbi:DNA polymerase family A-domain-containing protein [Phakopsora pachyrhizi]|nr:DNA polymerase family A-domain-containing protein [Phakopsora pachyrhizi]
MKKITRESRWNFKSLIRPSATIGTRYSIFYRKKHHLNICQNRFNSSSSVAGVDLLDDSSDAVIRNPVGVQLLPRALRNQIFPKSTFPPPEERAVNLSKEHLLRHGLAKGLSETLDSPSFELPPLQGDSIDQHFKALGIDRSEPFLSIAKGFATKKLPPPPTNWSTKVGWTVYHADGSFEAIDFPPESETALVMDVETLPRKTQFAVLATAVSDSAWYSWLSPWLLGESDKADQLIPMPSSRGRLIIGHHVGFDRARIRDEYSLENTCTRFIDTLSLHVATSGLSNPQRPAYLMSVKQRQSHASSENPKGLSEHDFSKVSSSKNKNHTEDNQSSWKDVASMNSLEEVSRLHCGIELDKSDRNAFLEWDRCQIVEHLHQLLDYCARDVSATHAIYSKLLPDFLKQCPHPVSFSGMLNMGNSFLPVDKTWDRFLEQSESTFLTKSSTVKSSLLRLAEATRKLMFIKNSKNGKMIYETDHWLKQLDWTPKKARWTGSHGRMDGEKSAYKTTNLLDYLPAWFNNLHCNGRLQVPLKSPAVALLFKIKYLGHPVLWSRKVGWMFSCTSISNFDAKDFEEINPSDIPSDIPILEGERFFAIPPVGKRSKARVRTLLNRRNLKLFTEGIISSPYNEALKTCKVMKNHEGTTEETFREIQCKLCLLANEAKELNSLEVSRDPWLRQLDWTLVSEESHQMTIVSDAPISKEIATPRPFYSTTITKKADIPEEDKVWPHWYWLLTRGGLCGMSLTTKSQLTPILLRLSFLGFPLYRSRKHGWTFRVPLGQMTEAFSSKKPLKFNCEQDPLFALDNEDAAYFKLPHPEGESENVGSPLSKFFDTAFENGTLQANPLCTYTLSNDFNFTSSAAPFEEADSHALADNARQALSMNMECSYWLNASQRIKDQMVVWKDENESAPEDDILPATPPASLETEKRKQGIILPQISVMGTVTRRATEKTWLAAANAKKGKIGTELKSMVRAPRGFAIVGADVDSEELWISSIMGDAQFGMHGATAIGWMTLEGTKAAGTDLHSKTANILGISRNDAKVFNYSRIYGAGISHAVQLLMKADPKVSKEESTKLAKKLYASTKGIKNYAEEMFGSKFWFGGTESYLFNKLEQIALADNPETPALGCGITRALRKCHLPNSKDGPDFMTSRVNWAVQSSGVDYLHMLIVAMDYLIDRYGINARYMISVHDEIRYLSTWEDRYRCALALQIGNLWTRCQFAYKLEMDDLPQSCAWFSAVDVDHVLRKEVDLSCVTPSNPTPISPGQSLDINQLLKLIPNGLGRPVKPVNARSNSTNAVDSLMNEKFDLKHRSTDMEWLAAQASQSVNEVRSHWNLSLQLAESELIEHHQTLEVEPGRDKAYSKMYFSKSSPSLDISSSSKRKNVIDQTQESSKLSLFKSSDDDLMAWKIFDQASSP